MTALDFYKNRLKDRGFSEKQIKDLTDHKDLPWLQFAEDYHSEKLILSGVLKSLPPRKEYCWPDPSMANGSGNATHSSKLIALSIKTLGCIIQDCFQEPKR